MTHRFELKTLLLTAIMLSACGDDGSTMPDDEPEEEEPTGQVPRDASATDASTTDARVRDASTTTPTDAGMDAAVEPEPTADAGATGLDASAPDAAVKADAAVVDAAVKPDAAAAKPDAAVVVDAGGGNDAGTTPPTCSLTYDNFGKDFINTYCISCHTTPGKPVFTSLANVQMWKDDIKAAAVTSMDMPKGPTKPSAADRVKLGQWLDCGPL